MQLSERNRQLNQARYDDLSIPGYVIERNHTSGAKRGPTMRQCMYCKGHEVVKKAHKYEYKTVLGRRYNDDKYRKSLTDIGRNEEGRMQYDKIALEDHSYIPTKEEVGTRIHGNPHCIERRRCTRTIESAQ